MAKKIFVRVIPRKERGLYEVVKGLQLPVTVVINLLSAAKDIYDLALRKHDIKVPTSQSRYKLMMNQLQDGSTTLVLAPAVSNQSDLEMAGGYADPVVNTFGDYFENMNIEEEAQAKSAIDESIKDPADRVVLLSRAYNVWSRDEFDVEIITGVDDKTGKKNLLNEHRRASIKKWQDIEEGKQEVVIEGAITRLQLDGKPSYGILTTDGKMIKSELNEEARDRVLELIQSPVRISGTIEGSILKSIENMTQIDSKSYNRLGPMTFPKPLVVDFSFENNLFVLKNDSLGVHSWGITLQQAENSLIEDLQYLQETFVDEDDAKLTPEARSLKKRLIALLEGESA